MSVVPSCPFLLLPMPSYFGLVRPGLVEEWEEGRKALSGPVKVVSSEEIQCALCTTLLLAPAGKGTLQRRSFKILAIFVSAGATEPSTTADYTHPYTNERTALHILSFLSLIFLFNLLTPLPCCCRCCYPFFYFWFCSSFVSSHPRLLHNGLSSNHEPLEEPSKQPQTAFLAGGLRHWLGIRFDLGQWAAWHHVGGLRTVCRRRVRSRVRRPRRHWAP